MTRESSVAFGAASGLIGTLSLPPTGAGTDIGVLLFNAGIVPRIGPHRINVRLARLLADAGLASIRFDLAGHGDSARASGGLSFEEQAVADIRSAMDSLAEATGLRRFVVFGYCSGAYYGYATALVDERVCGVLMYDAYRYPTYKTLIRYYWQRLRQPGALKDAAAIATRVLSRSARTSDRSAMPAVPELGRIDFVPTKTDFASGLRRLLDRGVRIHMIYSGSRIDEYNYSKQFDDAFAGLGVVGRIGADFFEDLDHVASGIAEQRLLIERVVHWSLDVARGVPA